MVHEAKTCCQKPKKDDKAERRKSNGPKVNVTKETGKDSQEEEDESEEEEKQANLGGHVAIFVESTRILRRMWN